MPCQAILHNRVAEVRRSLSETTNAFVGFDEYIAVVDSGQAERIESNQRSERDAEAGVAKDP